MPAYTNAKQTIPDLFQEIIRNHDQREYLRAPKIITLGEARAYRVLQDEMERFRVGAEKVLCWNTDKGNTK